MRKFFAGLLMLLINFYFLIVVLGVLAALYTNEQGPLSANAAMLLPLAALVISAAYQYQRKLFRYESPGEIALGSSKDSLLEQRHVFTITRIPLFLLLLLTLMLPGNLLDGLSEGRTYSLSLIFTFGLSYFCFYRGLTNFFLRPSFLAAALFVGGLLLAATLALSFTREAAVISLVFVALAAFWLLAWLLYRRFYQPPATA